MSQCESEDYVHVYDGAPGDSFSATVNGHSVNVTTATVGAGKIQVTVAESHYQDGDTLKILKNGDIVDTISITSDCP